MSWHRDVFFVGVVLAGGFAVAASLIPPRQPARLSHYTSAADADPDLRAAVGRVDAAFRKQWADDGLAAVGPAPDLAVARRLALGLMGTVPSLEEVRRFEALPPNDRLGWWLDHVLADRRTADYLAERFARSYVGTEDGPFLLFRRRKFVSWLSDQLAANRPYDEVVRDLIATDGLWTDRPATNFVTVTAQPDKDNAPDPVRLAGRVTRGLLGFRLDCAQCHNHPFAPWKQSDFDGIAAFFGKTRLGFRGVSDDGAGEYLSEHPKTKEKTPVAPKVPYAAAALPADGDGRQRLAAWVTSPQNAAFARATVNRVWAILAGRPLVEPVDDLDPTGPAPPALDALASDFAGHGYDLRRLVRVIANTAAFRLDSRADRPITEADEKGWAAFPLTRLRPEQVAGSLFQAGSVTPVAGDAHLFVRLMKFGQTNDFLARYGDAGEDEFEGRGGTIPQRLLLMNGELTREKLKESPLNAATRIAWLAGDDRTAIEAAYLSVLTRRPTPAEQEHFERLLADPELKRTERLEDLFWALVNSTEFAWNH
ncbi:MAG: DUF1553 domain-containing protein [Gemmataceae bacterium]